jgi:predicted ArsR family transcriptional regulator
MQSTKQQLLALLKKSGSLSIEAAANSLSIASMTARQHLMGLEKDGFVAAEKSRGFKGRPHYLYFLTPKGDELFPRRYDLFAQVLLEEVGELKSDDVQLLTPDEKRSLIVQRTADRLADRYRFQVQGRALEDRVAAVTDVLHLIGGFAEWERADDVYEIRDYNCVFARLVQETHSGCEWHVRLITRLLQWPVAHELIADGRVHCCRYVIDPKAQLADEGLSASFHV